MVFIAIVHRLIARLGLSHRLHRGIHVGVAVVVCTLHVGDFLWPATAAADGLDTR